MNKEALEKIINIALAEDFNYYGDITSKNTVDLNKIVYFAVNARSEIVCCIEPVAQIIFKKVRINFKILKKDGDVVASGNTLLTGSAKAIDLLQIERVFLNFIRRTCGVSTHYKTICRND